MQGFRVWGLFWEKIWLFFCGERVGRGRGSSRISSAHERFPQPDLSGCYERSTDKGFSDGILRGHSSRVLSGSIVIKKLRCKV